MSKLFQASDLCPKLECTDYEYPEIAVQHYITKFGRVRNGQKNLVLHIVRMEVQFGGNTLIREVQPYEVQTQHPSAQRLMMPFHGRAPSDRQTVA